MKPGETRGEGFLSRWSRLKREAVADPVATPAPAATPTPAAPSSPVDPAQASPASATAGGTHGIVAARGSATTTPHGESPTATVALPPVDGLTIDSDYSPFFQPRVPDALRRAAVKKLFTDPHFNVMDGLDTYIDDYSKPDPLPEGWLAQMNHARDLINHPSNWKPEEAAAAARGEDRVQATQAAASETSTTESSGTSTEPGQAAREDAVDQRAEEGLEVPVATITEADPVNATEHDASAIEASRSTVPPFNAIHDPRAARNRNSA